MGARIVLDTRQKVDRWNMLENDDARIGDCVQLRTDACPMCFARGDRHDATECYVLFPPIVEARVSCSVDCPTCGNVMLADELKQTEQPVIMCGNPHCPDNGNLFRPPTTRLERVFR